MIELKIFRIAPHIVLPRYATDGSSGLDICANVPAGEPLLLWPGDEVSMPLGFKTAFNELVGGWLRVGFLLMPRSGLGSRGLAVSNTVGLIDGDYRDEWVAKIRHWGRDSKVERASSEPLIIHHQQRILQAVPVLTPRVDLRVLDAEEALGVSARRGGFGSTGDR